MTAPTSFKYQWNHDGAPISGATGSSYKVRSVDVAALLTCTVTAVNSGGSTSVFTARTAAVTGGLPAAPTGPAAPAAGFRVVLADDFAGTSLDPALWTPTREFPGAADVTNGYNSYEAEAFDSANVAVAGGHCTLTARTQTVTPPGGVTKSYTSGVISTSNAANPFMFSPQKAGTVYIEARLKIPGGAPGSASCAFPAFWATSCRRYGATSNSGDWTREMDFFEFHAPTDIDSVNLYPAGGYGTDTGNLVNNGAYKQTTVADMATDFHVYTVQVDSDGSFRLWIDGAALWTVPAHTAIDWMGLIFDYALDETPGAGWGGDNMVIDYVMAWQDASVPAGTGVLGGGVAAGSRIAA